MNKRKKQIKRPITIRHSHKTDTRAKKLAFAVFRFLLYGMIGVFAEVCLYSIIKIGRTIPFLSWAFKFEWRVDERLNLNNIWNTDAVPWFTLFGQCSLWMFLVYAVCAFFTLELIYRKTFHHPWFVRGIYYAFTILAFEFASGFALEFITTFKIWYYNDTFNILHMTSLYTLPMWFLTGMLVEVIYRELMESDIRNAIQQEIDEAVLPEINSINLSDGV